MKTFLQIQTEKEVAQANKDYHHYRTKKFPTYVERRYGITLADATAMLVAQNYLCAICGQHLDREIGRGAQIEHCHKTGRVRGIVCLGCNLACGWIQDDPARAARIIEYLTKK